MLHLSSKYWGYTFVTDWAPDNLVFSVFISFICFISAFRTSHALGRYTEAAALMHKLTACWFDAASGMIAFCRVSEDDKGVHTFIQTLARLISLVNALCLDDLQHGPSEGRESGYSFEILAAEDLDEATQQRIFSRKYKAECVFQMIQQSVVDAMKKKVIAVPPPILSRSFHELSMGMMTFHEAKKIADAPLPTSYAFLITMVLCGAVLGIPWMVALYCQGVVSTFCVSLSGVFALWYLNGVADALDNPFRKLSDSIDASAIQREMNFQMMQLVEDATSPGPTILPEAEDLGCIPGFARAVSLRGLTSTKCQSINKWRDSVRRSVGSADSVTSPSEAFDGKPVLETKLQVEGEGLGGQGDQILGGGERHNDGESPGSGDPAAGASVPPFQVRLSQKTKVRHGEGNLGPIPKTPQQPSEPVAPRMPAFDKGQGEPPNQTGLADTGGHIVISTQEKSFHDHAHDQHDPHHQHHRGHLVLQQSEGSVVAPMSIATAEDGVPQAHGVACT
jgi:predicted membrane chloride channel (bestrophin family)